MSENSKEEKSLRIMSSSGTSSQTDSVTVSVRIVEQPTTPTSSSSSTNKPKTTKSTDSMTTIAREDFVLVVNLLSRFVELSSLARTILLSLTLWQLILIVFNVTTLITVTLRKRSNLIITERTFYWLELIEDLLVLIWSINSLITVFKRKDNLTAFTLCGMFALILIMFELFLVCRFSQLLPSFNILKGPMLQEALTIVLQSSSRIICFLLWIYFMNQQLSAKRWSSQEFEFYLEHPFVEEIALNIKSPLHVGSIKLKTKTK